MADRARESGSAYFRLKENGVDVRLTTEDISSADTFDGQLLISSKRNMLASTGQDGFLLVRDGDIVLWYLDDFNRLLKRAI